MGATGGKGAARVAACGSLIVLAMLLALGMGAARAGAEELHVLAAGSLHGVLPALTQQFELQTHNYVPVDFASVGELKRRIEAGAQFDVMILTPEALHEVDDRGLMRFGTRDDLGTVSVGVAVPAAAAAPDVSTPEALRAALLSARVVIYGDPKKASSAIHFAKVLAQLGISKQVAAKARIVPNGIVGMAQLAKETGPGLALGITQISEIAADPGVKLVGPLPGDLAHATKYAAALAANSRVWWTGYAYLSWLTGPEGQAALAKAGFQVP
jgi:molybdate transport system substrate-binding protein